jgi:hypothetical protein
MDLLRCDLRVREARRDRARRKHNLELASRQSFFVDGEHEPSILQQRRAGIVAVPDAKDIQLKKTGI